MNDDHKLERFGDFLRKRRLSLGSSLRAFCQSFGEDPSNWSKMERGLLKPPSSVSRLCEMAKRLGIEEMEEKQRFLDLADAERGRIPEDIQKNKRWVSHLPVFFRTIRGEVPTEEELLKLADMIREDMTARDEEAK